MHDNKNIPHQMTEHVLSDLYKRRKALLISIQYTKEKEDALAKPLRTPHRDARRLKDFLVEQGYPEEGIVHLADDLEDPNLHPTRANVVCLSFY